MAANAVSSLDIQKLKVSLGDAIQAWANEAPNSDGWNELDMYVGDKLVELMTDSAFNILLAQKDHNDYLAANDLLKEGA